MRNGLGWRAQIQRARKVTSTKTRPTREEAERDLAALVEKHPIQIGPKGQRALKCGVCKQAGHNSRTCRLEVKGKGKSNDASKGKASILRKAASGKVAERLRAFAEVDAKAKAEDEADGPANIDEWEEEDYEAGWGPTESDGRQRCVVCEGEGIDRRVDLRLQAGTNVCLHCDGEGFRSICSI